MAVGRLGRIALALVDCSRGVEAGVFVEQARIGEALVQTVTGGLVVRDLGQAGRL